MQQLQPQQFATWAEPIEMLYACHSKVKRFCKQLQILPAYLAENGVNQAVKNDVQQILNYFNRSAPLHHEDEEQDFFPILASKKPEAQTAIDELLAGKQDQIDETLIQQFIAGYDVHIAIEEPLFEMGRECLDSETLSEMGKMMAARRKL